MISSWSRLPLLGSLLHVPHVPGLLTNAAQWFIQRYGKLVIVYLVVLVLLSLYMDRETYLYITLDKSSSKAVGSIEADIWGFWPLRLDFTLVPIQQLSSTPMRTREIFSTKTSSQACLSFFIFPPSCNIEQPILGRPDSFVYRFRMLGGKLGFEQKNNWKSSY